MQFPFSQRFPRILSEVITPRKKDEALNRKYDYSAEPFRVRRSSTPFLQVASFLGSTKRRVVQRIKASFHSIYQFRASHFGDQFEVEFGGLEIFEPSWSLLRLLLRACYRMLHYSSRYCIQSSLQSAVTTGELSTATFPSCAGSSVDHLHRHHLIHGERLAIF